MLEAFFCGIIAPLFLVCLLFSPIAFIIIAVVLGNKQFKPKLILPTPLTDQQILDAKRNAYMRGESWNT